MATQRNDKTAILVKNHMKEKSLSLKDFSKELSLDEGQLSDFLTDYDDVLLIGNTLYYKASLYSEEFSLDEKAKPAPLSKHVEKLYRGNLDNFIDNIKENPKFIHSALRQNAYWVAGEVFLPINLSPSLQAVPLRDHIERVCDGKVSAFARAYQVAQQQMHRWVTRDCFFCQGEIYLRRTDFQEEPAAPTKAFLLRDYIAHTYGEGSQGILAFTQDYSKHNLNAQQVRRYLGYDALWIQGDVYKNQSKFGERGISPDFRRAFKPRKPHVRKSETSN
jgi:hypothetical protein